MSTSMNQKRFRNSSLARWAALLLGASTTLASGAAGATDWPGLGLGASGTRLTTETLGPTFSSAASWTNQLPPVQDAFYHALVASPAAADGFVVFGTSDNRLRALRESDGRLLWEVPTGDSVYASPVVYRGRAFAATASGQLLAVNLADGSPAWSRAEKGPIYGAPVVADGALYVAVGDPVPALHRLDPATGEVVWRTARGAFTQAVHGAPAVGSGHVVVGQLDGVWRSFSAATGALEWTASAGGVVQMTGATILDGTVYLVAADTTLAVHALDLATGAPRAGWPLAVSLPADATAGTPITTRFVASSPAAAGPGRLAVQVRRDDRFDQDSDGIVDLVVMDEVVVAVDLAGAQVAWTAPALHATGPDDNHIPGLGLSPSPAAFPGDGGSLLLASSSTVSKTFRILDAATGAELSTHVTTGVTRGSPTVANGGLLLGTDDGLLARWASSANQPPDAPAQQFVPSQGATASVRDLQLAWGAAREPEGQAVTYVVRWDDDGEVLRDWDGEITTAADLTSARPTGLVVGRTYTWAVRARDARGALSPWSSPRTFVPTDPPPVTVGGHSYSDLGAAVAAAVPGDVVTLGVGVYGLNGALVIPAGVAVAGMAPHLTVLQGNGLSPAVVLRGGSGGQAALRSLTVAGATVGVRVDSGDDVELRNVILRDNAQAGLEVASGARAALINATAVRNGAAARVLGVLEARNTLVTGNDVGLLAADLSARIATRFSNVFGNRTADRSGGAAAGLGDLAAQVQFASAAADDVRLRDAQASTDRGDPADDYSQEPAPNGARVNIGAFGNTPYAELSAVSSALTDGRASGAPTHTVPEAVAGDSAGGCVVGGSGPVGAGADTLLVLAGLALAWARRRRR